MRSRQITMEEKVSRAALSSLIRKGKDWGYLSYQEIYNVFPDNVSPDQIKEAVLIFKDLGIKVLEEVKHESEAKKQPRQRSNEDSSGSGLEGESDSQKMDQQANRMVIIWCLTCNSFYNVDKAIVRESLNFICANCRQRLSLSPEDSAANQEPAPPVQLLDSQQKIDFRDFIQNSALSVRAAHAILNNISEMAKLMGISEATLKSYKNCGQKTASEILDFVRYLPVCAPPASACPEPETPEPPPGSDIPSPIKEKLAQPPDAEALELLPIFSGKPLESITPDDLHPGFKASLENQDIAFTPRILNVLQQTEIRYLGELLLYPPAQLLKAKNFGHKSLREMRQAIRELLIFRTSDLPEDAEQPGFGLDHSSYQALVGDYLKRTIQDQRNQEIFIQRFLPEGEKSPTLVQLGKDFGLTRERVRQILIKGKKNLQIPTNIELLQPFFETIKNLIARGGGLIGLEELGGKIQKAFEWEDPINPTSLGQVLELCEGFVVYKRPFPLVSLLASPCLACETPYQELDRLFANNPAEKPIEELCRELPPLSCAACSRPERPLRRFHQTFIIRYLTDRKGDFVVRDGWIWLAETWRLKHGRNLEAIISQVLEEQGKPLHYKGVTRLVRKVSENYQDISDGYVHNVLVESDRFRLFKTNNSGVYGLAHWPDQESDKSAGDAIQELLEKQGLPMKKEEIISLLRDRFGINPVQFNLCRGDRFVEIGEGYFDLPQRWESSDCDDYIRLLPDSLADFARFLINSNNCSYKPVLALVFLKHMDSEGSMSISELADRFYDFYLERKRRGLVVEDDKIKAFEIVGNEDREFKRSIIKNPLKSFIESNYFEYEYKYLEILPSIKKENISIILFVLLRFIKKYYKDISYQITVADTSVFENKNDDVEERYPDFSEQPEPDEEEDDIAGGIMIKKSEKKICL